MVAEVVEELVVLLLEQLGLVNSVAVGSGNLQFGETIPISNKLTQSTISLYSFPTS